MQNFTKNDDNTVSAQRLCQSALDASGITHFQTIEQAILEAQKNFLGEGITRKDAADFAVSCIEVDSECFYAVYFSNEEIDADDNYAISKTGYEEAQEAWDAKGIILEADMWAI